MILTNPNSTIMPSINPKLSNLFDFVNFDYSKYINYTLHYDELNNAL